MQERANIKKYSSDTSIPRDGVRIRQAFKNVGDAAIGTSATLTLIAESLPREEAYQEYHPSIFDAKVIDFAQHFRPLMNPWLSTAGTFANDPYLDAIEEEIYVARDESRFPVDEGEDNVR